MLSNLTNRITVPLESFIRDLKLGEHGCIFFTSREVMRKIHCNFLKAGLESNMGGVYATAVESPDAIRKSMAEKGIDTEKYESDGSLILVKGEDLYRDPHNPDINNWKEKFESVTNRFISKGKSGVRVAADLSSHFISNGLDRQWFELEHILERKLSVPASVLCAYDALSPQIWSTDVMKYYVSIHGQNKEFIDMHSFAIFASDDKSIIFSI